ncbi:MAG: hypothetical protein IJ037_05065 [Clostridia bacterium]|nr:hypothetical protein [Clostridia bacterium]
MYTRNFVKQKYTPPPGYDGTAFNPSMETKRHEPQDLIREERTEEAEIPELLPEPVSAESPEIRTEIPEIREEEKTHHPQESALRTIGQLMESLRGRLGSEELIILLVMLLIAEDGLSAEVLILGLLLIAGSGGE